MLFLHSCTCMYSYMVDVISVNPFITTANQESLKIIVSSDETMMLAKVQLTLFFTQYGSIYHKQPCIFQGNDLEAQTLKTCFDKCNGKGSCIVSEFKPSSNHHKIVSKLKKVTNHSCIHNQLLSRKNGFFIWLLNSENKRRKISSAFQKLITPTW